MAGKELALPTMAELVSEDELTAKQNKLMVLLSQPPPENWVKVHPFIKGHKYLPIGRIEYLLKRIFTWYKIEVLERGMILNSVAVTVRVWYRDPVSGEDKFHDGVGAWEVQTKSGSGPLKMDMSNIQTGAIQMALPIAKSVAIKDACDHFGPLFGSDLNHKEHIDHRPLLKVEVTLELLQELYALYGNNLSADDRRAAERIINTNETKSFRKLHTQITNATKLG